MNDRLEQLKMRREEFAREREQFIRIKLQLSGRYDQWILTLAGGALAVSLAFLQKIAPTPVAETLWCLVTAWACLILALVSTVVALIGSQYALGDEIRRMDWFFCREANRLVPERNSPPNALEPKNRFAGIVHVLNCASIVTFVVGITLLCTFAYKNLGQATAPALRTEMTVAQAKPAQPEPRVIALTPVARAQPAATNAGVVVTQNRPVAAKPKATRSTATQAR